MISEIMLHMLNVAFANLRAYFLLAATFADLIFVLLVDFGMPRHGNAYLVLSHALYFATSVL